MPKNQSAPIRATTQDFVEIDTIDNDLVILKDGSAASVIETTAVNFGLLSEEEQDALIYAYAAFLNSLSFPIQISIMSKRMDISLYLDEIIQQENKQQNPTLKTQLQKYHQFIQSIVRENKVLEKRFYIIVPFSSLELGAKGALLGGRKRPVGLSRDYIISRARASLEPKKDHVLRQIARIGLKGRVLSTQELVELFYNIYNPPAAASLAKLGDAKGYEKPLVESLGI
ncbi:hypothetical protein HYW54_02450 [Candidatus Gottesmanbacteria bacterium]|nr:hypothetical protein [Candidatus Gottesmanbacteria bacterium]